MHVNEQAHKKSIPVYEVLPLMAELSILNMESEPPKFRRHLFLHALERISKFEIDENGRLEESSQAIGSQLIAAIRSATEAHEHFGAERDQ